MFKGPPVAPPTGAPRPDRDEPSHTSLLVAFVVSSVAAIVLGVLAVGSLLREPAEGALALPATPTVSAAPSPSPTPTPARGSRTGRGFTFIEQTAGGHPVRWDPCQTITFAVNIRGAFGPVQPDLRKAIAQVTAATGIEFVSVGTTRETFFGAYTRMRYARVIRRAELIFIWVPEDEYRSIRQRLGARRSSIAFAKTMAGLHADRDQYFGGIIVMDADATLPGFGSRYSHGVVLLHELGHIMGLAHVKDPHQVMYSGPRPDYEVARYGTGDLEGLRRVGLEAGCLD